jgi:hypothetical protein
MGKILQYLGVSEEGQSRDVLDAERLLEGMQMIYSQSPDGSKKDSFSIPLAEMTKIFIEKVKGIEPTPTPIPEPEVQEELPFKVGDKYVSEGDTTIYTIVNIGDTFISFTWTSPYDGKQEKADWYLVEDAKSNFETGYWTLVKDEELPFKVGDRFLRTYNTDDILTIEDIEDTIVTVSYINIRNKKEDSYYPLDFVKEKFASGEWYLIKEEEFPYKVNDKFKVQDTIEKFAITNINEDTVEIAFVIGDGTIDLYNLTKEEFLENVALGRYIKITDEEFSPKPQKPKRTRKPKEETEQDKQIREILEINLDDIDL